MKEKPILFSGPMIQAILEGKKTQTRRVIKPQPDEDGLSLTLLTKEWMDTDGQEYKCPYGEERRNLWVRETFSPDCETVEKCRASFEDLMPGCSGPYYKATASDFDIETLRWKPSIHMPRWASRINLEITDIRVERVQDISEEDAKAEGIIQAKDYFEEENEKRWEIDLGKEIFSAEKAKDSFQYLWDSINGKRRADGVDISWSANPWVWVITFNPPKPLTQT